MRGKYIFLCVIALIAVSTTARAEIWMKINHGSCTIQYDETISQKMALASADLSLKGGDLDSFLWGHLCEWKPNSTFTIFGKPSGGFLSPTLSNKMATKEFTVTVNNCSFRMAFSSDSTSIYRTDERKRCDKPSNANSRGGIEHIIPQAGNGAYSVICKDGSAGSVTQHNPPVWCALSLDGQRNRCSETSSRQAIAEWMCR